jgi:Domain of unknown function (DUF4490)
MHVRNLRRFQQPEAWSSLARRKQHPCYTTSASDIGAKAPTNFDMPLVWAGVHGAFSASAHGGPGLRSTLKTALERSRVHRELDGL